MTTADLPFNERAVVFDCEAESLVGVIAEPDRPARTAVVIVVGGPQYRAGSHRQFVQLARALAAKGHAVLRFDCRGMGDSGGTLRSFEAIESDIRAAIDTVLREVPIARRVVLWGLCDAASAALMYVDSTRDRRLAGLCLANPWVRSELSLARTQVKHYYTQRLRERGFWLKLLSGKVAWSAVLELWRSLRAVSTGTKRPAERPAYVQRMLQGWQAFSGPILLLCSGVDYTAREFLDAAMGDDEWRTALGQPNVRRFDLATADHTFSNPDDMHEVNAQTERWLHHLDTALPA